MKTLVTCLVVLFFSSLSYAEIISKRTFLKYGKPWVEETHRDANGRISIVKRPQTRGDGVTVDPSPGSMRVKTKKLPSGNVETTHEAPGFRLSQEQRPKEYERQKKQERELSRAIASCSAGYRSSQRHPMLQNFTVQHQVHGMYEGKCKYTQTMPKNRLMTCMFSNDQRKQVERDKNLNRVIGSACEVPTY